METIKRREALKRAAWIMGGALSAPTIAGFLNGCTPKPELTWKPSFFTEDQARLVMQISEGILPETDTPGANSLGVPAFIEEMVSLCYKKDDQEEFVSGMQAFMKGCEEEMGNDYGSLDREKQVKFLTRSNDRIRKASFGKLELSDKFFWRVKELTLIGYYTSEYGATQALQYQPIPVRYKGCIPLSEAGNGKAWAT